MRALRRFRLHIAFALIAAVFLGLWLSSATDVKPSASGPPQTTSETLSAPTPVSSNTSPAEIPAPTVQTVSSGTLRGRVIDADTKVPIRDFRLELQRLPAIEGLETPPPKSFRNTDGRFEWTGIRADRWRLIVSAADYQRFELDDVQVEANRSTADLLVPLRRGALLTGRVYDQSTGQGIAKAQITFREPHVPRFAPDWRHRRVVSTGERGHFKFEGLPRGRVTLSVSAAEYADREMDVATNDSPAIEIALSAGATIAGLLTASDGATAIAGSVGLIQLEQEFGATINTEPNGEFTFRKLSPGRYRLIGKTERGRAEQEVQIASDERVEGIVLAIQSGGTIRGLIRGVRPQDLSRLNITVRRPNSGMTNSSNARIDEHGGYVLSGVEAGRMIVIADIAMRRQLSKTIDMPANGDMTVDFDFPAGARLSGRVTRGGVPSASTRVQPELVSDRSVDGLLYPTATNANGEYAIDELAQGEYIVRVGSYRSPVVRLHGDTTFDIDVPLAAHFAGRVVESEGDVPVVGATVDVWAAESTPLKTRLHASSNHLGEFALSGLEPGEFVVTIHKPGYQMYREQLTYGSPISDRTIRLSQSRGVDIRIRDSRTGEPLRGVYAAEISNGTTGLKILLHPDENGYSQLPSELAGNNIAFSASGFFTTVIPRWNGRPLQLSLRPEGSATGQ